MQIDCGVDPQYCQTIVFLLPDNRFLVPQCCRLPYYSNDLRLNSSGPHDRSNAIYTTHVLEILNTGNMKALYEEEDLSQYDRTKCDQGYAQIVGFLPILVRLLAVFRDFSCIFAYLGRQTH